MLSKYFFGQRWLSRCRKNWPVCLCKLISIMLANVFVLKHCTFLVGCPVSWTSDENTNYLNGVVNSADSVEDCQSACISNASCNGVDWDGNHGVPDGRRCWLSGPWSGAKRDGQGVTHYNLNRNCTGKDSQLRRLYICIMLGLRNTHSQIANAVCLVNHEIQKALKGFTQCSHLTREATKESCTLHAEVILSPKECKT